jgi:hypothetical protein
LWANGPPSELRRRPSWVPHSTGSHARIIPKCARPINNGQGRPAPRATGMLAGAESRQTQGIEISRIYHVGAFAGQVKFRDPWDAGTAGITPAQAMPESVSDAVVRTDRSYSCCAKTSARIIVTTGAYTLTTRLDLLQRGRPNCEVLRRQSFAARHGRLQLRESSSAASSAFRTDAAR